MRPRPHLYVLCIQKQRLISIRITSLSWVPAPHLWFFACKTATLGPELQVSMCPSPHLLVLCIHNSDIMTRINSLYGSQTSPIVLYMLKAVIISTRITSLLGSQISPVVLCMQNNLISIMKLLVSMGPDLTCCFCMQNSVTFASELQISMGPRLTCRFVHAKQRD